MSDAMALSMGESFALCPEQQMLLKMMATAGSWGQASRELLFDIRGELDMPRLQSALQALFRLHPVLAARLRQIPGFHGLRLCEGAEAVGFNLSPETGVLSGQAVEQRLEAWRRQHFATASGPWAQAILLRLGEQHWRLVVAVAGCLVDNASLRLLADSLGQAYQAPDACQAPQEGRYEQYLEWRAETAIDEDAQEGERYWRQHLLAVDAAPALTRLPYRLGDNRGQAAQRIPAVLEQDLLNDLQRQAVALSIPLPTLLQAAWWALLSRVTGQSAFLASWRHDSREDYEYFADCAGVLEKTLPVSVQIALDQPFSVWATGLGAVLEQHVAWQEYWSANIATLPAAYGFALVRDIDDLKLAATQWSVSRAPFASSPSELLLQLQAPAQGRDWTLQLDYLPDCYSVDCARRLLEQYVVLLRDIARDCSTPINQLNLTGEAERHLLLALNPPRDDASAQLLPQRIHTWGALKPGHDAVRSAAQHLTYEQLEQQVRSLAARLATQGVKPGDVVALSLPRSSELLVSLLAIWWLGAAYTPLDPQWPQARQIEVAGLAGASLILAKDPQSIEWTERGLTLFDPASTDQAAAVDLEPYALQGHETAYVLFTSGSTGVPKGVVIEHRQLANYVAGASQVLGLAECRHFAFTSSVAADLGNTTLFGALYNGACLQVADEHTLRNPEEFARYLQAAAIDCLKIVPSHLAALLETPQPQIPATVVLGGEAPAPGLIAQILQIRPDCRLFNHYGPTEATVGVMVQALTPATARQAVIPLGRVLPGNQVYVLDAHLRLLPLGVQGELYIGGRQLCRGYVQEPQADVFVDNPFEPGARLYRTGDLARHRPDGSLELLGRKDQQINLNGFRIELGEIEAQLLRLAAVREAAVVSVVSAGSAQPVAFVAVRGALADASRLIRNDLALHLPAAFLPRHIRVLDQLPRLANGKIDRHALAHLTMPTEDESGDVAGNALQGLLAQRMASLLGREALGIHQDFFSAGGHSLLVIRLVAGLRKLLRCEISPAIVFDNPTVASLAQALGQLPGIEADKLEAIAQAMLRLDAMSDAERALLEAQAQQLRADNQKKHLTE